MVTVGVEGSANQEGMTVVRAALLTAGAPQAGNRLRADRREGASRPGSSRCSRSAGARYQQLAPTIYPIPGTVFQTMHERAPLTPGLGYVVGSVGPVTAQQLQDSVPRTTAQSVVGQTGLESAYQRQLAGQPGATVTGGERGRSYRRRPSPRCRRRPGAPVQTSIDPAVQRGRREGAGRSEQEHRADRARRQHRTGPGLGERAGYRRASTSLLTARSRPARRSRSLPRPR